MLLIPGTGFQYLTVQLGFWIPIVSAIPDSKTQDSEFHNQNFPRLWIIGHFTVMDGSEADSDLVLIETFLLYYVNQVILMLTSIFQGQFP